MSEKLTINAGQVVDPAFVSTCGALAQRDLPAAVAYWVAKVVKVLDSHAKEINAVRLDVFKKYGKEVEGRPGDWTLEGIEEDKMKEALTELNELALQQIELPISKKIVLPATAEISAAQLAVLDVIVTVEGVE